MPIPTHEEWIAHIQDSARRDHGLENSIAELTSQVTGLRITVESFANRQAQLRASAQLARSAASPQSTLDVPRGPLDTHDSLAASSVDTAADVLQGVDELSLWKKAPALVAAIATPAIGLAVAFGVILTDAQKTAIGTFAFVVVGVVAKIAIDLAAHNRNKRTRKSLVRAMTTPRDF